MKWRCVVDMTRHCSETPDWDTEPYEKQIAGQDATADFVGGTCKLTPDTCGKCKTSKEMWDELPEEIRDKVSHPKYVETVTLIKPESKGKPKSAKAKKLEEEIMQGSMFQ